MGPLEDHPLHPISRCRRRGAGIALLAGLAACTGSSGSGGGANNLGGGTIRPNSGGTSFSPPLLVTVRNDHPEPRVETVLVSVPFPQGAVTSLSEVGVRGRRAAWLPLQRWPDGSVRVAQAQFTDVLPAGGVGAYEVVRGGQPLGGRFEPNSWVAAFGGAVRLGARVRDTFGVPYEAEVAGPGETVQETFLSRVRRYRLYHRAVAAPGIGRDYLTSTFYVTELQDSPFLVVDWIVGNDYLGIDDTTGKAVASHPNSFPLGAIDVRSAEFLARGAAEVRAYQPSRHAIEAAVPEASGWTSFRVMQDTFIDDGQTRRYRFALRVTNPQAPADIQAAWTELFAAFVDAPLRALAALDTWQDTGALGLHGGPLDPPSDAAVRADQEYDFWSGQPWFGTWGSFGDTMVTSTGGTPRNTAVSDELFWAVQSGDFRLLERLEQKAWAQAMRPYHLFGLQVGTYQDILLWEEIPYYPGARGISAESLGRRALWANDPYADYRGMVEFQNRAHGWNGYDHEHWTTDLLFDYWTVSGDAWAKEELRQLGESLKGLMRLQKYATAGLQAARAEGWCMQGFVQAYLATGDPAVKDYALLRIHDVIDPQRGAWHASQWLATQGSHALTGFPNPHEFFMPWQHAAVIYGFVAAHRFFEDATSLAIAEAVATTVEYSWVTGYHDPTYGYVQNGLRYYTPVKYQSTWIPADYWDNTPGIGVRWGSSPLGGAHVFLTGALHLLAKTTASPSVRQQALYYGNILLGPLDDQKRWYRWNVTVHQPWAP